MRQVNFLDGAVNGDPARGIGIGFRKGRLPSDKSFVKRNRCLKKTCQRRASVGPDSNFLV